MEPVNSRGPGLRKTHEALARDGHWDAVCSIIEITRREEWSWHVARLVKLVQSAVRAHFDIDRLRFLLYPSRLIPEKLVEIQRDDAGVVWLGKAKNVDPG